MTTEQIPNAIEIRIASAGQVNATYTNTTYETRTIIIVQVVAFSFEVIITPYG
jgi:hypothetical protein